VLGFLLGSAVAYLAAMSFVHRPPIERAFYPLAIAMKAVPVVAVSPLLIVWCGNGLLSKVVMAALICFFPVLVNMVTGLKQIDSDAYDLFRLLSATRLQTSLHLRIPASLPYLFSSLKVASSLAVVGAIVAEFAGADKGLGYAIMVASYRLETAQMFAAIFYLSALGLFFFGVVAGLESVLRKFTGLIPEQVQERRNER
jgi:NitT/TauT family transport system permease protein